MKAALIHEYGPPEVLQIEEVPAPECGPQELLIEVHAAAINPIDWKIRKGAQRAVVRKKLPAILGMDLSGVVVEVGSAVQTFKVGDEVFSSPSHRGPGTYAELVAVAASEVALKPRNLSHAEAASIPLVGLTAWDCLVRSAGLKAGESVFIEAGAGGVGSFAIQLAKSRGATVTTTCSPRNTELVTSLGADRVIDYTKEDFGTILPPQDVALEAMGGASKFRCLSCLRRGGRLTSINGDMVPYSMRFGPYLGLVIAITRMVGIIAYSRLWKGISFSPIVRKADGQALAKIAELLERGTIKPIIDKVYPLEEIVEAHRHSQSGHARGKIVLQLR